MVEALGISLKEFIFYLINFILLTGVLGFFLYRPFLDTLDKRKQTIKDALDSAEAANRRADEKMANYERRIANAEEEGREIIRLAKRDANDQAKAILNEASAKAGDMILQAEREIERERASALRDMKAEIADLALLATAKILEEDVAESGKHDEIIDRVIAETENSSWQN